MSLSTHRWLGELAIYFRRDLKLLGLRPFPLGFSFTQR
jgi:hypothetical protein